MKIRKAIFFGASIGALLYLLGSAGAYLMQNAPVVGRPAYFGLKLLNYPSLYIGIHFFPRFLFNAGNIPLFLYTLAINLPLAAAVGCGVGYTISRLMHRPQVNTES